MTCGLLHRLAKQPPGSARAVHICMEALEAVVSRAVRVFVGWILFAGSGFLFAGVHPVPLDKNTPPEKCAECHADKAKGKFVHSAIATGCTSCHEIRGNKDVTRIKLTTTTTQALCLSCHADHNAADLKGTVHPPAVRDCVKCHDPHQSGNQFQLLKPTSGDKNQNLCLECHTQGLNVPDKGSRHAALDMSCQTCHVTHKVGEHGKQEFDYHLTKASPALCLDCHDAKDASLIKAHQGQPFANANCVQCHDPHQSRSPKLMQAFAHPPFAMNACDTCHKPAANGKVVLTQADSNALCVSCHSEQAEKFKKAHLHQPAYGLGCATCHEPHGGTNEHLLRAKGSALFLECHGPEAKAQKLEAEHVLTIFNGTAKLPEDYFQKNKVVILPIKYGLGHPVIGHPVQDVMDPADITKVKNHIDCMTCHQPHASTQPGLLAKDQANNMAFCDTCHKNRLALK